MSKVKGKEATPAKPWEEIGIGDQVKHASWGVGTVLFRSGAGDASKAIVVFPEEGQKKLMLKYANLKKVGSAPKSEVAAKIKAASVEKIIAAVDDEEIASEPLIGSADEDIPLPEDEEADIFEDDEEEQFSDREETIE